ncbi:hypothetical protein B7494_g3882 [Chlorociboria aeruginascens]|nr:hypothetical protein B7494_g3882 [Chlorociboria aeruginascens]
MTPAFDTNGVWLVTGCSSGLGKSIAKYVYNAGHNIVATARNVDSLQYLPDGPKVLKLSLDVTSLDNITEAINATVKRFGHLNVTINNAGGGSACELEGFPIQEARKCMETMFWGPVHLTKESIRVFREVNTPGQGGTIIQVSSIGGYFAAPGNSFYHASKFALEGFSKSVNKELNPKWNIKLMILSPGAVKTNFINNFAYFPRHPAYANDPEAPLNGLMEYMADTSAHGTWADPDKCAAVLFNAVMGQKARPLPMRLNLGADTLPLMRAEIDQYQKEMNDWKEETVTVNPSGIAEPTVLVETLFRKS